MMVGPANTDAINQAGRLSYGEATGVTQTTRNFGASLGLAALGTLFTAMIARRLRSELVSDGVPRAQAAKIASTASQGQFGSSGALGGHGGAAQAALHAAHDAVAYGMRAVLFAMAGIMAVAFFVALLGLRRGFHFGTEAEPAVPDEHADSAPEGPH
jgi:hypothetical protein